jgi:AcrR family transcriptional regulator
MPRPSQNIDQALLASGRSLYPLHGCSGLSVRQICEHAGVNAGMFHYHFQSKDNYLATLLQGLYEEVFTQLQTQAAQAGSPKDRLRASLYLLAGLLRSHGNWIGWVWTDAGLGASVATTFLQRNAPRHMGLLMALSQDAEKAGEIAPMPPMQRFGFLMGAVLAPMVLVPAAMRLQFMPPDFSARAAQDVLSDDGIADRLDRALAALALTKFSTSKSKSSYEAT